MKHSKQLKPWSFVTVGLLMAAAPAAYLFWPRTAPSVKPPAAPAATSAQEPRRLPQFAPNSFALGLSRVQGELEQLEHRLTAVETADAPTATSTSQPTLSAEDRAELAEELDAKLQAELEQRATAHRAAPRDAGWANETQPKIASMLERVKAQLNHPEIGLAEVDCRTDSCVATLEFPSYEAASAGAGAFVTRALDMPCTSTALLPTTPSPGPVRVPLLFLDCQKPSSVSAR